METSMDEKPKRLRPWLESLIDSRIVPGLEWEDEEKTLFRIPWKHRGKHDWSPENSRIFMEWAKQTGRFREGVDAPDYPAWKTRLRCAFNKAPDIEEVRDMSRLDAACPYRIYRLKTVARTGSTKSSLSSAKPSKPHSVANRRRRNQHSTQDRRQVSTTSKTKNESVCATPEDFGVDKLSQDCSYPQGAVGDCGMVLKATYCGRRVLERTVRSPWGCRVSYDPSPASPFGHLGAIKNFVENIYGPSQAESVALPSCVGLMTNGNKEKLGMELLERGIRQGVVLRSKDNNIYAYRLCQSAVFYSSHLGTCGRPVKLRRVDCSNAEPTLLFDYRNHYLPALGAYLEGLGSKPNPYCYLVFGQDVSMFNLNSSVLIVVAVASQAALCDLEKAEIQHVAARNQKAEEEEASSNSNELDTLAETLISLCHGQGGPTQPNCAVDYNSTDSVPTLSDQDRWYHTTPYGATDHHQQQQQTSEDASAVSTPILRDSH